MFKKCYGLVSLVLILIIIIFSIILFFVFMENKELKKVCINENCFKVETANTPEERSRGLMNKESLAESSGMLFVFDEEGIYSFWMKNTLIPLDIVWINKNKEIIYIEKNAQPCKTESCQNYGPAQRCKYVLEINGGLTDKLNIKAGDKLTIDF
jgi:uncharacterized protein